MLLYDFLLYDLLKFTLFYYLTRCAIDLSSLIPPPLIDYPYYLLTKNQVSVPNASHIFICTHICTRIICTHIIYTRIICAHIFRTRIIHISLKSHTPFLIPAHSWRKCNITSKNSEDSFAPKHFLTNLHLSSSDIILFYVLNINVELLLYIYLSSKHLCVNSTKYYVCVRVCVC